MIHLDAHSWYSFHDGVDSPEDLCAQAAELGFEALGIADAGGTYGLINHYKAALKYGIKPILGMALAGEGLRFKVLGSRGKEENGGRKNTTVAAASPPPDSPRRGEAMLRPSRSSASVPACDSSPGSGRAPYRPEEINGTAYGRSLQNMEDGLVQGTAPTQPMGGTGGSPVSEKRTVGNVGVNPSRPDKHRPGLLPGNPAVVVIASDRQGYSQLCELAAWWHGCLEEGNREEGRGKSNRGIRRGGTGGSPVSSNAKSQHEFIRKLEAADRCFVITDHQQLLQSLAPRIGPRRLFVRTDADYGPSQRARQIRQLKLARHFRLHPLACTDVRFIRPQDQVVHHVLRAIGGNATLHTATGVRPRNHYLAAPTELPGYYYDCPEALANTRKLVEHCNVDFELGKWIFPDYDLSGEMNPRAVLRELCMRGMQQRYGGKQTQVHQARLDMELKVIDELGYTSYFLAVYDIVCAAKRLRIPWVGRGSAANSIASYLLGFTPVDPIRYNMYFERFLNPQRQSPPDIDIDFNWRRRDEILQYIYDRWGHHRVAMISTHVTFRGRSAFRETAKVFGMSDAEISTVAKYLPHVSADGLTGVGKNFPEMRGVDLNAEPYCHTIPLASRLSGRPRHLGIHCGGVVIAPGKVTDFTGLQRAAKGFVVTQYDMYPVEDVGLIKIDILGNRSLGVLEDTLNKLREGSRFKVQGGEKEEKENNVAAASLPPDSGSAGILPADSPVSPVAQDSVPAIDSPGSREASSRIGKTGEQGSPLPLNENGLVQCPAPTQSEHHADPAHTLSIIHDYEALTRDPATVEMIRSGNTMACFYIESPGMRQLLRRLKSTTFLDLTAASSVIRPGVAESGMMQEYIRRVRNLPQKQQTHPLMRELLPETHGVMIYQEDVIKVAHEVAGMGLAEADLLRRAMSGKLRSHTGMNEVRERFIAGCEQNGVDVASALEIWRQMASFAGYSFCKAHSASFATLSFQVAYLKAHHPAVFMAAVISNGGGFYGARTYLSECERLGLAVLPPDVNYSMVEYTAEKRDEGRGKRDEKNKGSDGRPCPSTENKTVAAASLPADSVGAGHCPRPSPSSASVPACESDSGSHEDSSRTGKTGEQGSPLPMNKDGLVQGTAPTHVGGTGGSPVYEPNAIRVGLGVIKGIQHTLIERIVTVRQQRGIYRSLPDFIRRTGPNKSDLSKLILVGALDSLGLSRPELLWLAGIEHKAGVRKGIGGKVQGKRFKGKENQSGGRDAAATSPLKPRTFNLKPSSPPSPLPFDDTSRIAEFRKQIAAQLDDFDLHKLCALELEHLGMIVRCHPLELFINQLSGLVNACELPRYSGKWVKLLGWCIATKRVDLGRRKEPVSDVLELQAETLDTPEPAPGTEDPFSAAATERGDTAAELGLTRNGQNRPSQFSYTPGRAMKFLSMEDLTGTFETTLFADAYRKFAPLTRHRGPFLVYGKVEEQFGTITVNVTGLRLLSLGAEGAIESASDSGQVKQGAGSYG